VTFTFNRVAGAKAYRRLWVPGYGHCYAADIGSWIKADIVDVWFPPGPAADNWGIQRLTLTVE